MTVETQQAPAVAAEPALDVALVSIRKTYGDVVAAYASTISGFSPAEQRALFCENAVRIFGLDA